MTTMATNGTATVTLPSDTEILITREFGAPRHLVFKAWTTPELVKRWWAGKQGEMTVAEIDLRVGGRYRFVLVAGGQYEVGFHGEYREIVPNERIVNTEVFEGLPDPEVAEANAAVNVVDFEDAGERTTLKLLVQCGTQETRDAILSSGMEEGMQQQYDALEALVISLR